MPKVPVKLDASFLSVRRSCWLLDLSRMCEPGPAQPVAIWQAAAAGCNPVRNQDQIGNDSARGLGHRVLGGRSDPS